MVSVILYILIVCGTAAIVWFLTKVHMEMSVNQERLQSAQEMGVLRERLHAKESLLMNSERESNLLKQRLAQFEVEARELVKIRAELQTRLQEQQRSFEERVNTFETLEIQFKDAFSALSSQALKSNNESFMVLAKSVMGDFQNSTFHHDEQREMRFNELVKPLSESLFKVDTKISEIEKDRVGAYHGLKEQVQSLLETQTELRRETGNLVRALRSPITRGRWGEIQLKRVVEMAGMVDHCDFFEQQTVNGEDGKLRPDMIIKLPGGKTVVVDAKTPLYSYLDAIEAQSDDIRLVKMVEHAGHVKKHIQALSQKAYWDQFQDAPEFVVLFLPGEPIFSAALEQDPSLIELGVEQRVLLATPTTLIALLRAVSYGWRQERLADNAREICELGKQLFNRLADMSTHVQTLGQRLKSTVDAYNKTVGTLESRVFVSARRFKELDAAHYNKDILAIDQIDLIPREVVSADL